LKVVSNCAKCRLEETENRNSKIENGKLGSPIGEMAGDD
jgi:hypothetical protein